MAAPYRRNCGNMIYRARFAFWAALIVALFAAVAHAEPTVRPFVEFSHRSDLFTGPPFKNPPGPEPTEDSVTIGAEISWPMWALDLSHGVYARDCSYRGNGGCEWQSGTRVSVRRYFVVRRPRGKR